MEQIYSHSISITYIKTITHSLYVKPIGGISITNMILYTYTRHIIIIPLYIVRNILIAAKVLFMRNEIRVIWNIRDSLFPDHCLFIFRDTFLFYSHYTNPRSRWSLFLVYDSDRKTEEHGKSVLTSPRFWQQQWQLLMHITPETYTR